MTDPNSSTNTANAADPLQAALDDAQQFLQEMDVATTAPKSHDFSIDSDDEDEDEDGDGKHEDIPLGAGDNLHPLHDQFLPAAGGAAAAQPQPQQYPLSAGTAVSPTGATPPPSTGTPQQQQSPLTSAAGSAPTGMMAGTAPSMTTMNPNMTAAAMQQQQYSTTQQHQQYQHQQQQQLTLDAFKQQTSKFASWTASVAKQAAANVQAEINQAGSSVSSGTGVGVGVPALFTNPPISMSSMLSSPQRASTTMTSPTSSSMMMNNQSNVYQPQQQVSTTSTMQQQPHVAVIQHTELDNEQKMALVKEHVGELLPGEKIIMFLSNLLHVSHSQGGFTFSQQSDPTQQWYCVMTYYRVILFGTTTTTTTTMASGGGGDSTSTTAPATVSYPVPEGWNAVCWPMTSSPSEAAANTTSDGNNLLQMPLASLDRVDRSVFAVPVFVTQQPMTGATVNGVTPPRTASTTPRGPIMHRFFGLTLTSKLSGRWIRFSTAVHTDTDRAMTAFQTYAFPGRRNLGYLFAFESKRDSVMASIVVEGGNGQPQNNGQQPQQQKSVVTLPPVPRRFDPLTEYRRQFGTSAADSSTNDGNGQQQQQTNQYYPWMVWTKINQSYQLCLNYPSVLVGPASLGDCDNNPEAQRTVRQTAAFRSEQRLPVLTWCAAAPHHDGASLWRCSQPKMGLQGNRSGADELFLESIMESAANARRLCETKPPATLTIQQIQYLTGCITVGDSGSGSSGSNLMTAVANWIPNATDQLKILDCRPRSSAMANRTQGYGYENTANYPGSTIQFCNIGNIHAVRDSYQKLTNLIQSATGSQEKDLQWNAALEETKWFSHTRSILAASWETAYWIHVHRLPVLLHCSHGWDRTSQVAVLAQLMLDPYYRSIRGFACLIEKDFLAFGHPFHTRCAHGEGRRSGTDSNSQGQSSGAANNNNQIDEGQISPIFLQFLDCCYQLVSQYPDCFQFNTNYLLVLAQHVYSCRFGNFLCDTEREREMVAGIRQRTHSVWDYLDSIVEAQQQEDEDSDKSTWIHNPQWSMSDPTKGGGVLLMPLPTLLRNVTLWTDLHCAHGPKPTQRPTSLSTTGASTAQTQGLMSALLVQSTTSNGSNASPTAATAASSSTTKSSPDTTDADPVQASAIVPNASSPEKQEEASGQLPKTESDALL